VHKRKAAKRYQRHPNNYAAGTGERSGLSSETMALRQRDIR